MDNDLMKFRVAVVSSDGIVINQHFGRAEKFMIYDVKHDHNIIFLEERFFEPLCQAGFHDAGKMTEIITGLADCKYVLASRIGQGVANALEVEGISPMELPGIIQESIQRLIAYDEVQSLLA